MNRGVFNKEWWFDQPWRWAGMEEEEEDELRVRIPFTNWKIYNQKAIYFPFCTFYEQDKFNLRLVETY